TLYQQPVATSFVGPLGAAGSSAPFAFAVPTVMTFAGTSLTFQGLALGARTELSPVGLAVIGR
ncbi:MAG: hypothetical protein KDE27_23025, partial [Planctomycetes bacterium]|nr:hypothetical protein [Planctomycetota bacterium]